MAILIVSTFSCRTKQMEPENWLQETGFDDRIGQIGVQTEAKTDRSVIITKHKKMSEKPAVMPMNSLVHPEDQGEVPAVQAIKKCGLFQNNTILTSDPYSLQSTVSLSIFREFGSALEGNSIEITARNIPGVSQLCEKFGFRDLTANFHNFEPSKKFENFNGQS
jgi:hypothetical protein